MIEFIRKNKDLRDIFEGLEENLIVKKAASEEKALKLAAEKLPESTETLEGTEAASEKKFYQALCEEFVFDLARNNLKYSESLIRVNISFSEGEAVYRISFPLIDINESQSKIFVSSLKKSIKEHVDSEYSINLCLRNEEETHNIILVLEKNKKKFVDHTNKKGASL